MEDTKICFRCGETKPLSSFYKQRGMGDGHLNKCKECTKKDVRLHRTNNLEKVRGYDRKRNMLPHRVKARKEYNKTTQGKISKAKVIKRYREKYPKKYKAMNALNNAIRDGKIKRQPCIVCGATKNIHAHHEDYSNPLEVLWLCQKHHSELHRVINDKEKEHGKKTDK